MESVSTVVHILKSFREKLSCWTKYSVYFLPNIEKAHTFWHTRVIFKHGPNCVFTPSPYHIALTFYFFFTTDYIEYTYWYWSRFYNMLFRQHCFSFELHAMKNLLQIILLWPYIHVLHFFTFALTFSLLHAFNFVEHWLTAR